MQKDGKHVDVVIAKELHYKLRVAAAMAGMSIAKYVTAMLEKELHEKE